MLEEKVSTELTMMVVLELNDYNNKYCSSANSSFSGIISRIIRDNVDMREQLAKRKKKA